MTLMKLRLQMCITIGMRYASCSCVLYFIILAVTIAMKFKNFYSFELRFSLLDSESLLPLGM